MPIPTEITDILSEFGLPAGAIALAVGLVRGAKALEEDASEPALKYVSGLLVAGGLTNFGKLSTTLIPIIFSRIFGSQPLSLKFISRSCLATTLLWLILLAAKHPNWDHVLHSITYRWSGLYMLAWYSVDWISLLKAWYLINIISSRYALASTLVFFMTDVIVSFTLIILVIVAGMLSLLIFGITKYPNAPIVMLLENPVPIAGYLLTNSDSITLFDVVVPSTLLTSIWTFMLLLSSIIAMLLMPIDQIRRFTAWWFRDVEKRPLTAIAKVAGTLIIIGAVVLKAVRWVGV